MKKLKSVNKSSKLKKTVIAIVCVLLVAAVAVGGVLLYPVSLGYDVSSVDSVGNAVQVKKATVNAPTAIFKIDAKGEISDEPFKILGFTDTHLDAHGKNNTFTVNYMVENIKAQKPDIVVIDGDVVTAGSNKRRARELCELFENLGVYWTLTLGNHEGDNPLSASREELIKIYSSYEHCLVDSSDKTTADGEVVWGNGNTQINILGKDEKIVQSLFLLDSGNEVGEENAAKYTLKANDASYTLEADDDDFIKESQVKWYTERVSELPDGVKSIVFCHIPLPEFELAFADVPKSEDKPILNEPDENGTVAVFGEKYENICEQSYNTGLFDAIIDEKSTQAVICGHDHVNTLRMNYKGVLLCYNRASGYSSYNIATKGISDELMQGATLYTVASDGNIEITDIINRELYDTSAALELCK